jgi:hypothetical protein
MPTRIRMIDCYSFPRPALRVQCIGVPLPVSAGCWNRSGCFGFVGLDSIVKLKKERIERGRGMLVFEVGQRGDKDGAAARSDRDLHAQD